MKKESSMYLSINGSEQLWEAELLDPIECNEIKKDYMSGIITLSLNTPTNKNVNIQKITDIIYDQDLYDQIDFKNACLIERMQVILDAIKMDSSFYTAIHNKEEYTSIQMIDLIEYNEILVDYKNMKTSLDILSNYSNCCKNEKLNSCSDLEAHIEFEYFEFADEFSTSEFDYKNDTLNSSYHSTGSECNDDEGTGMEYYHYRQSKANNSAMESLSDKRKSSNYISSFLCIIPLIACIIHFIIFFAVSSSDISFTDFTPIYLTSCLPILNIVLKKIQCSPKIQNSTE